MSYSPVSSEAKAIRKGLPTRLTNSVKENWLKSPEFNPTRSRAVNYKFMVKHVERVFDGSILMRSVDKGKTRKDEATGFIVITPKEGGVSICGVEVLFKDPVNPRMGEFPITVTRHAVERMAQRQSNYVLAPLNGLFMFHIKHLRDGSYEVGCATGMSVVEVEDGETTAITFVDGDKLRPDQPYKVGEYRRIK